MSENNSQTVPVRELTLGEKRVKIDFNTTSSEQVDQIKANSASMINECERMRFHPEGGTYSSEKHRLLSLAQTAYEEAAMWAVKANFTK